MKDFSFWPYLDIKVAPTVAMGPLADGSISNFACNISIYLCTNFGALIKKCTIRPKMAAYPLYYIYFFFIWLLCFNVHVSDESVWTLLLIVFLIYEYGMYPTAFAFIAVPSLGSPSASSLPGILLWPGGWNPVQGNCVVGCHLINPVQVI